MQNVDVFEANDSQYNTNVSMAVSMNKLPDIMVVSSQSELEQLIENGAIEDLTDSYNNCLTDRIKSMYASYGIALMDMVTYDGKIMALPETNISIQSLRSHTRLGPSVILVSGSAIIFPSYVTISISALP